MRPIKLHPALLLALVCSSMVGGIHAERYIKGSHVQDQDAPTPKASVKRTGRSGVPVPPKESPKAVPTVETPKAALVDTVEVLTGGDLPVIVLDIPRLPAGDPRTPAPAIVSPAQPIGDVVRGGGDYPRSVVPVYSDPWWLYPWGVQSVAYAVPQGVLEVSDGGGVGVPLPGTLLLVGSLLGLFVVKRKGVKQCITWNGVDDDEYLLVPYESTEEATRNLALLLSGSDCTDTNIIDITPRESINGTV